MGDAANDAVLDLLILYRTSRLVKALYPQWNQTIDGAKTLLAAKKQEYMLEDDLIGDEFFPSLSRYIEAFQSLKQKYNYLNDEDKYFLFQNETLIRQKAETFFKEDVFTRLEEVNYLLNIAENDSQESLLKAQESRWAQVYAEHFGTDGLSFLYTLFQRSAPAFETAEKPVLSNQVDLYDEGKLTNLLVNLEYRKIYLTAKYPNNTFEQLNIKDIPLDDVMKLHYYLVGQKDLEKMKNKMTMLDRFSFEHLENEAQDTADKIFKNQVVSAINHYCGEYVDSVKNNELYSFKLLNENMELYKNRYGEKALDELPAVKSAKELWEQQEQSGAKKNISTVLSGLQETAAMPALIKEETVAGRLMQSQHKESVIADDLATALRNKADSVARA